MGHFSNSAAGRCRESEGIVMKKKYIVAVLAGAAAEVGTMITLWTMTDMQIHNIVFWSVLAYFGGIAGTNLLVERLRAKRRVRKRNSPPSLINVDLKEYWYPIRPREEQGYGRECTAPCKGRKSA